VTALTFGIAELDKERRAVFRLRYDVALERGWADEAALPEGIEREEHDEGAVFVVARSDGEIVGALRLIVDGGTVARLLTEHGLDQVFAAGETVFIGRFLVARPYRARARETVVGLGGEAVRFMRGRAVRAISFAAENSIRFCQYHGFPLKIAGPPRPVDHAFRSPVVFDAEVWAAFVGAAEEGERRLLGNR
jgi:hypothetical protein